MTTEEAIKELREASDSEVRYGDTDNHYDEVMKRIEAFDMAIKALEQKPCEDCINRKEVNVLVDELARAISDERCFMSRGRSTANIMQDILDLPSVQPTRPTGKWIKMPLIEAGQTYSHECSLCGRRILITDVGLSEFPYCHCGARMEESEEEE